MKLRKKQRLWNQYLKTKDTKTYTDFRRTSNQLRHLRRKSIKEKERNISDQVKTNPKSFWQYVNQKSKYKVSIPNFYRFKAENKKDLAETDIDKAEALVNQFSGVFTKESNTDWDLPDPIKAYNNISVVFSNNIVLKKLQNLSINKSPDPDDINSRILVELAKSVAPSLSVLFQNSYDTGIVPSYWKRSNITPIYKKDDKKDRENYRPVSLTSILCKIMESIIKDHLLKYLNDNNILSNKKYGFLPGRSTVLQLLNVPDQWTEAIDTGFYVDVICCDFMKAFDKVPHKRLLKVSKCYCIPSKIVDLIESFLTNRKQRVIVNGTPTPSSWYNVISGVPQGSVLGSIMFVIYINTLIEVVTYSDLLLFAVDNKLFKIIQTEQYSSLLQYDNNSMYNWTLNSLPLFHPKKCFTMHVDSKSTGSFNQTTYKMIDNILEDKLKLKDLGVIVDKHLTFSKHIAEKVNKANQIVGLIRRTFVFIDKHNFNLLYKGLVRPHIEYGNIVWSPFRKADINLIEHLQRRATRFLPEINKFDYHKRLEKLNLPQFPGSIIETYKILHNLYDADCTNSLFELKESNTRGHKFAVKTKLSRTSIRRDFFSLRKANLWNSLSENVAEAPNTDTFKNRFDRYCRKRNLLVDVDIDYINVYALSALLKSRKK